VQAFSNRGDASYAALAKGIAAMVISDLSKVPGLKLLERQKVQKLVDEIQLSESGLVSQDNQVKAGRLMRAEKIVVGSFGVQ
jgi:curli biogenesis system outer membrane secretion channel CsgG